MLLLIVGLAARAVDAAMFVATLDRGTLMLGESATLVLTFEGEPPSSFPAPEVSGLQITQTGTSRNMSWVNGVSASTLAISFSVTPQKTGEFTIPAITASVGGQPLATQPLKLKVGQPSAPSAEALNSGDEVAFLKLNFTKQKMFTGESAVMQLELYLRDEVQNFGNFQFAGSNPDGFSIGKIVELPDQRRRVQLGSRTYTIIPFSLPFTTVKSGVFALGPFTANLAIVVPGNGFFGQQKQVAIATATVNIETLPLPVENRPVNFTGAIGNFTLAVTAGPTTVTVGDPVTVRVQISGQGSFDAIALPTQDAWRDFKTYPPTAKLETNDPFGFRGRKLFEQIVSPLNADVRELPALTFSFFNPEEGKYHTLTQPSVPLTVRAAASSPLPNVGGNKNAVTENQPAADILPIKENLGIIAEKSVPLLVQPKFFALQGVPVLAWLAAFIWRKRTDSLANNPRLRRRRAVAQIVRAGTGSLKKFAAENKPDDFFATLFRLLQEQVGERLDCPASAITENVLEEPAVLRATPKLTREGLHELFQLCNQARYAPVRGTTELNMVAAKFEQVMGELQEVTL